MTKKDQRCELMQSKIKGQRVSFDLTAGMRSREFRGGAGSRNVNT